MNRLMAYVRAHPALLPFSALALVLVLGAAVLYGAGAKGPAADDSGPVPIGGPFRLIGPDGATVTERSFPGKWTLVFFGYTFCPDVCPTTMNDIARALEKLGPRAAEIQPIFITVDPKRDTPTVLKDYTAHFDPRIIGLTGSPEAVANVLKAYRVYAAERPAQGGEPALFDHSAILYLMNPAGAYAAHFTVGQPSDDIAAGILKALDGKTLG